MYRGISIFFFLFLWISAAQAAELRFEPAEIGADVAQETSIVVDTDGEQVNAVEGVLVAPAGTEILDVSDANSIISLWLDRPEAGREIRFAGLIPGGFSGRDGEIIGLLMKAPSGEAVFELKDVRLYRNDGSGTLLATDQGELRVIAGGAGRPLAADTDPPDRFEPIIARDPQLHDGKQILIFQTQDKGSGMDHYEVMEVSRSFFFRPRIEAWERAESPYVLKDQSLESDILVRAVDKKGNFIIVTVPAKAGGGITWYVITAVILLCLIVIRYFIQRRMKAVKIAVIVLFAALAIPSGSQAASLYFFPESAVKIAGADFTVSVYANSSEQSMNAVSGVLEFPADKLEVVSLSKSNSIVNVWVQEPSFSNQDGRVRFEGVVLNPGFKGGTGRVLGITFRPKAAGIATLSFSSGSVLANDGEGTNILRTMGGASYTIKADAQAGFPQPKEDPAPSRQLSNAPLIKSATHPMEDKWYNGKKLELAWEIPPGADGVSYALDASSNFQLVPQGKGLISNVQYDIGKFKDGIYYFYLRFHTASGWGPVGKRMVRIDFSSPSMPVLSRLNANDPTSPRPVYIWEAKDEASGVVKYQAKIGDGAWEEVALDVSEGYALPPQLPGERQLAVRAYDEAGNHSDAGTVFSVEPIASPTVDEYTKSFYSSEPLKVSGRSIPEATIRLLLRREGEEISFETKAGKDGTWRTEYSGKLKSGEWQLAAIAIDEREARSLETEAVKVTAISTWVRLARVTSRIFQVIGTILIILGGVLGLAYFTLGKSLLYRFRLRQDFAEFKSKVRSELKALEGDLESLKQSGKIDPSAPGFQSAEKRLKGELARLVEDVRKEARLLD